MKYYLAPMEGITGYIYRNVYRKHFPEFDRYFTPFISVHENFGRKVLNEIDPETNRGIDLVPQAMASNAEGLLQLADMLVPFGYRQINLNAGCPSGTVTGKNRGSGLLKDPDRLEQMLTEVFDSISVPLSIKTRLGWSDPAEWERIAEILGQFPFSEVIIHARVREEFYNGEPHREAMEIARELIKVPLVYNGDIYSVEDAKILEETYPWLAAVMIGRGVLRRPQLVAELHQGKSDEMEPWNSGILAYMTELHDSYRHLFKDEINAMYHMKELWYYLGNSYPDKEKELKAIRKCKKPAEYVSLVNQILK